LITQAVFFSSVMVEFYPSGVDQSRGMYNITVPHKGHNPPTSRLPRF
jgi:hypothetical protein